MNVCRGVLEVMWYSGLFGFLVSLILATMLNVSGKCGRDQ